MWNSGREVHLHRQDAACFCGPATAMMILHALGLPLSGLDQTALFAQLGTGSAGTWKTSPGALEDLLQSLSPAEGYALCEQIHNADDLAARLVASFFVDRDPLPAAVLLYGCKHWSVVCGIRTDTKPVVGGTYSITGIFMNIPIQPYTKPPPPHTDRDGCRAHLYPRGNHMFKYPFWTSVVTSCSLLGGTIAAICGPPNPVGALVPAPTPQPRRRRLSAAEAMDAALAGFRENGLAPGRGGEGSLQAGKPHRVRRTDRRGEDYYLVPMSRRGSYIGMALVDDRFGFSAAYAASRNEQRIRYPSELASTLSERPTDSSVSKLVWRPSKQSATPFSPFHVLPKKNGRSVFLRASDFEEFDDLSDACDGG